MTPVASINGYEVHSLQAMLRILCDKEGSIIFLVTVLSILEYPGEILMASDELVSCVCDLFLLNGQDSLITAVKTAQNHKTRRMYNLNSYEVYMVVDIVMIITKTCIMFIVCQALF